MKPHGDQGDPHPPTPTSYPASVGPAGIYVWHAAKTTTRRLLINVESHGSRYMEYHGRFVCAIFVTFSTLIAHIRHRFNKDSTMIRQRFDEY